MSKICPKCGRVQENPSHLGCEKCNVLFVDAKELVTNFTRDELKVIAGFLLKDWRVYCLAAVILLIGVGLLYWQVHERIESQIEHFQTSASNQVATAYSTATNQIAIKFDSFEQNASNQMADVYSTTTNKIAIKLQSVEDIANDQLAKAYSSVTNQIAVEFQTPRIKQTVETVAEDQAKSILEGEVQPAVNSFREDASFIRTVAHAQAYDFKAYQRLLEIGTQTNDNAILAKQVVAEIDRALETDRAAIPGKVIHTYMTFSGTNFYKGPFTSDELATVFSSVEQDRTSLNREGFINTVHDLNQPLFLSRLIEFFTNETDLAVADRLTVAISDITKQDFHPHDFEQLQTWWRSHENEFTNWPISDFNDADNKFSRVQLAEAAKSFQKVLNLDPSADMSRALAIDCYLDVGDTNQALGLVKGFKDPTARWAQWAGILIELHMGSTSNATVRIADFAKQNPAFAQLPHEGFYVWRNLDWQLFNKMTATEKPSP
jgi:hypothetical protein